MLDLLLDRAQRAAIKVYQYATVMPSIYELKRFQRSPQFIDMLYEALLYIAADDGKESLATRKDEILQFAELLAFVLWQLQHDRITVEEYYELLAQEAKMRLN